MKSASAAGHVFENVPYGAPSMHPEEKLVIICDLCDGDPQCVKHCPEKAIQYVDLHKTDRVYRSRLIEEQARGGK
jgi:carbon-monoxide dehydrogenase iron sulfur subunit